MSVVSLTPKPLCNGIAALTFIEDGFQTWMQKNVQPNCNKRFPTRLSARLLSFISTLYPKVEVSKMCNPRIRPRANNTNSENCGEKNNLDEPISVTAQLLKSSAQNLKVFLC